LTLRIYVRWEDGLRLIVEDNGVGVAGSADDERGGQGLILHGTMMAVVGGSLAMDNAGEGGTRVVLSLPMTVNTLER
jgi:two-component sensor histidine kinase